MKKLFTILMIMIMVLTNVPVTTEAKTKASITVTNKSTGKKVGKKLTLKKGKKVQLKVKYGKKVVTKKAKYKSSDKTIATVSKKGKITAKSAGTCTVKATYKKAVKKIKVTVKAIETTTEASTTEDPGAMTAKENKKKYLEIKKQPMATQAEIDQYLESRKLYTDPHPECTHEWEANWCQSDTFMGVADFDVNHLTLKEIRCTKCGTIATPSPIRGDEFRKYTSDDFAKIILYYNDTSKEGTLNAPHHKCKKVNGWDPDDHGWFGDDRCAICNRCFD